MDPLRELKGFDASRQLALMKKLGGKDNVNAILRDEKIVTIKDAIQLLFDKNGRRIPKGLQSNICDTNRSFRLDQPKMNEEVDFANRIMRLHECLDVDTEITAEQLKAETERLLVLIRENFQIANIANGVWLPVIMPQLTINDIGTALEQYLKAVDKSYAEDFGDWRFYNYREDTLAGKVDIISGSRHGQLIEKMKQGPVIGVHFPNPLQGFSINASCEQMKALPEGFILSGLDTIVAVAMYPDILACNYNTPGLDLAALSWGSARSLYFEADDDSLDFNYGVNLSGADDHCSGGLLFCG